MAKKRTWPNVVEEALTLPRFEFIAEFVAFNTATKAGRKLSDGMLVKRVAGGWAYGFDGMPLFPPMDVDRLYDSIRRTPLNVFVRMAEELRIYAHD